MPLERSAESKGAPRFVEDLRKGVVPLLETVRNPRLNMPQLMERDTYPGLRGLEKWKGPFVRAPEQPRCGSLNWSSAPGPAMRSSFYGDEPVARLTPLDPHPSRRPGRLRHLMSDEEWTGTDRNDRGSGERGGTRAPTLPASRLRAGWERRNRANKVLTQEQRRQSETAPTPSRPASSTERVGRGSRNRAFMRSFMFMRVCIITSSTSEHVARAR